MSKDAGETSDGGRGSGAPGPFAPHDEAVRGIALRRLSQIVEELGLASAAFEQARRRAEATADGSPDGIISEQIREATEALADISDPSVRARAVALLVALADDHNE